MSTERQREAAKQNARKSTGPRTAAGKAKSARNSLKHGFCSRDILVVDEADRPLWESRVAEYLDHYGTGRPEDHFHAIAAVNAEFKYRYINRAQAGFAIHAHQAAVDQLWGSEPIPSDPAVNYDIKTRLIGYAVMRDCHADNTFLKLSRYESEQYRIASRAIAALKRNFEQSGQPAV
ncbi:MAG TPA: hypothetical protein VFO36_06860, partial [Nitrospiraceae bacterium]|nr:hypothetical protein [Nitrospiraceae bacterium]